ncbi:MAG: metallophosphoesterase [Candidatus Latescibacterota bacterium]|nr:MAG: metallophosphoesterase [Candidatus Latescibacterota bacterium]
MRIAYTSDLHSDLGQRNFDLLDAIAARVSALSPDLFIVAGDVAETLRGVSRALERLAAVPCRRFYLPGNHDLFVEADPGRADTATSRDKYERLLPDIARGAGFEALGMRPVHVGGLALVGVSGWFDFTLRDPKLDCFVSMEAYRAGQWRGIRAYDRGHIFWPRQRGHTRAGEHPASHGGAWASDEEIHERMLEHLDAQLARVRDAAALVAVVHVVPFSQAVVRGTFGPSAFFDAYLGSARLGERLCRAPGLRAIIHGHQHQVSEHTIAGIRVLASPVGDASRSPLDLAGLARERVGFVDINAR